MSCPAHLVQGYCSLVGLRQNIAGSCDVEKKEAENKFVCSLSLSFSFVLFLFCAKIQFAVRRRESFHSLHAGKFLDVRREKVVERERWLFFFPHISIWNQVFRIGFRFQQSYSNGVLKVASLPWWSEKKSNKLDDVIFPCWRASSQLEKTFLSNLQSPVSWFWKSGC